MDFSPEKNKKLFLEKLAARDPELAKKYSRFKKEKESLFSAKHAYRKLQYIELFDYVKEKLSEFYGYDKEDNNVAAYNIAREVASIWFANQLLYKRGERCKGIVLLDYNPLSKIGVRCIDDLIELVKEYSTSYQETVKKSDFLESIDDLLDEPDHIFFFNVFLMQKLLKQDPAYTVDSYTDDSAAIFPKIVVYADEKGPAVVDKRQYLLQQFLRLEEEQRAYTEEAESIFLPELKDAYKIYSAAKYADELIKKRGGRGFPVSDNILDKNLIRRVVYIADPVLYITPAELKAVIQERVNGRAKELCLSFVTNLENYIEQIVGHKEYLLIDYNPEENSICHTESCDVRNIELLIYRLAHTFVSNLPIKEVESRYAKIAHLKDEGFAEERFASYMFQLARMRKAQLISGAVRF